MTIRTEPSVFLVLALGLLVLPPQWLAAFLLAAFFHELCHIAALCLFHCQLLGIRIGCRGTTIDTVPLSPMQELICALAGPAGSFFLLSLCRWIPMISLCAGIQGAFNLLPVFPLDGGRILRSILILVYPQKALQIADAVEIFVLTGSLLLLLHLTVHHPWGTLPLIAGILPLQRLLRKRPCKPSHFRVQ